LGGATEGRCAVRGGEIGGGKEGNGKDKSGRVKNERDSTMLEGLLEE
jgi:hypothetical protein